MPVPLRGSARAKRHAPSTSATPLSPWWLRQFLTFTAVGAASFLLAWQHIGRAHGPPEWVCCPLGPYRALHGRLGDRGRAHSPAQRKPERNERKKPAAAASSGANRGGASMKLVLLGTGTPNAERDRAGPAVAVVTGERALVIDAGAGVVHRALAAARRGVTALAPERLTHVLLTHLHSDHTVGLPDLLLSPWVLGRRAPVSIGGPPGTTAMVAQLQAAYRADIAERTRGLEPIDRRGPLCRVRELAAGPVTGLEPWDVEAFPVAHGAWTAYGYRLQCEQRVIVVSGDTAPCATLTRAARECDILLHEVYAARRFERLAPDWQRYHAAMHTSSYELGELAARVRPRLLVLYHALLWGASEEELQAEIRERYTGPVVLGRDLDVY